MNVVILERDIERDRKTCISLDLKVAGANRELAQWLYDHPRYSPVVVADWLGCGRSRIADLRQWAKEGFKTTPSEKRRERADNTDHGRGNKSGRAGQEPLKSLDNSDDEEEVASPDQVEDNLLHYLSRMNHFARVFKRLLRLSAFDREAEERMDAAIERTIEKWRLTQATLTRRNK